MPVTLLRVFGNTATWLVVCLGFLEFSCASAAVLLQPLRVDSVRIERSDVFRPQELSEGAFLGKVANAVHWLTREDVVRNEVLLRQGDVYNSGLAEESERNLRALGLFGKVSVRSESTGVGSVRILVQTQDRFSLRTGGSYSQEGNVQRWRVFYSERNFLGRGIRVRGETNSSSDRARRLGTVLAVEDHRLGSTRGHLLVQYKEAEDLRVRTCVLDRRFPVDSDRWAGSAYAERGSERWRSYEDGVLVREGRRRMEYSSVWVARSMGMRTKLRVAAGYDRARNESPQGASAPDDRYDLLLLSSSLVRRRYAQSCGIDNLDVVEDVPLGARGVATVGLHASRPGSMTPDAYAHLDVRYLAGAPGRHYLGLGIEWHSFVEDASSRLGLLTVHLVQHVRMPFVGLLTARGRCDLGYRWPEGRQLSLGSDAGLRGYAQNRFTGQRRAVLNIEDRTGVLLRPWIFRLGAVVFADAGLCWDEDQAFRRQRWRATTGFGLRVASSKGGGSGLVRIDVPFRLEDGEVPEIIITAGQLFGAYHDLGFVSPEVRR